MSLQVGGTVQLSATTLDANNNVLTGRVITWSSGSPGIGTVSASGLFTALAAGPVTVTAISEMKIGTATITVTAVIVVPPPNDGLWRGNEPTGMTFIDERPFNTLAENASPHVPFWDTDNTLLIVQDTTAPHSPSNAIRAFYPAGWSGGAAPGHAGTTFGGLGTFKTVYVGYWAKYSLNWVNHISNYTKEFYMGANGQPGQVFTLVSASSDDGTVPLVPRVCLQAALGTDGIFMPNLVPGVTVTRGQWFYFEVVLTGNTAGNADGSIDWFINGVHVGSRSAIKFTTAATAWTLLSFDPVYGGTGGSVPANQWLDIDHVYLSGK